jgi:hypothetical protein
LIAALTAPSPCFSPLFRRAKKEVVVQTVYMVHPFSWDGLQLLSKRYEDEFSSGVDSKKGKTAENKNRLLNVQVGLKDY